MQELRDIFGIWPSLQAMADDIGQKADTVYRWKRSGRIPEQHWPAVIQKAALREHHVTANHLLAANRTPKMRGRPSHKSERPRAHR